MFSEAVERAIRTALLAHAGQTRRGDEQAPYAIHPLHVAMALGRLGLDDDVVVGALLHDVVEDCDDWCLQKIEQEFDLHIASIVGELTEDKTQTWDVRKQTAIDKVPSMSPQAANIKAADKLHNLQSLLRDLRAASAQGLDHQTVWALFKGGRERSLEMAEKLVAVLEPRVDPRLARALRRVLDELLAVAQTGAIQV